MYVNLCLLIEKNVQILKNARIILYGGFFLGIVRVTVKRFLRRGMGWADSRSDHGKGVDRRTISSRDNINGAFITLEVNLAGIVIVL